MKSEVKGVSDQGPVALIVGCVLGALCLLALIALWIYKNGKQETVEGARCVCVLGYICT